MPERYPLTQIEKGTHADRPAPHPNNHGMLYDESDTGLLFVSSGAIWVPIGGDGVTLAADGGLVTTDGDGNLGVTGSVTVTGNPTVLASIGGSGSPVAIQTLPMETLPADGDYFLAQPFTLPSTITTNAIRLWVKRNPVITGAALYQLSFGAHICADASGLPDPSNVIVYGKSPYVLPFSTTDHEPFSFDLGTDVTLQAGVQYWLVLATFNNNATATYADAIEVDAGSGTLTTAESTDGETSYHAATALAPFRASFLDAPGTAVTLAGDRGSLTVTNGLDLLYGGLTLSGGAAITIDAREMDTPTFGVQVQDFAGHYIWLRTDGVLKSSGGIALNGVQPPTSVPSITGSRAAMGVATYQIIQALAACGIVTDATTA